MDFSALALVCNLAATWYMTGLIWFVQLVHYAQFELVGSEQFCAYHRRHTQFTTLAVGPAMLVEMLSAVALVALHPVWIAIWAGWTGLSLVALLWLSTAFLQVPKHNVLALGFDPVASRHLVRTNWLRTAGWTLRGVLMAWVLLNAISTR